MFRLYPTAQFYDPRYTVLHGNTPTRLSLLHFPYLLHLLLDLGVKGRFVSPLLAHARLNAAQPLEQVIVRQRKGDPELPPILLVEGGPVGQGRPRRRDLVPQREVRVLGGRAPAQAGPDEDARDWAVEGDLVERQEAAGVVGRLAQQRAAVAEPGLGRPQVLQQGLRQDRRPAGHGVPLDGEDAFAEFRVVLRDQDALFQQTRDLLASITDAPLLYYKEYHFLRIRTNLRPLLPRSLLMPYTMCTRAGLILSFFRSRERTEVNFFSGDSTTSLDSLWRWFEWPHVVKP